MMLYMVICAGLAAGGSYGCHRCKEVVEREVRDGRLTIRLGEDITGPSYQIAVYEVFTYVFGALAIMFTAIALSGLGHRLP